jgi:cyanophycin synthetase
MHLKPLHGQPRPVGEAIVEHMFGPGQTGRVPLVAVSGSRHSQVVAQIVGRFLAAAGYNAGQVDAEGVRLGEHWLARGDASRAEGGRRLLMNPFANAFVMQVTERGVLDEGLAFDRCQVAVVTDLDEPPPATDDEGPSPKARAVRAPVDVVLPTGAAALNADDPGVAFMARHCKGSVVYFASSPSAPPLAAHAAAGGVAVIHDAGRVLVTRGNERSEVLDAATLSGARLAGSATNLHDWLAAVASSIALGMTAEAIRSGFQSEFSGRPAEPREREAVGAATVG